MKRIALLCVVVATALVVTVPAFTASKGGYVMQSGDAVNAPATDTSCSYGPAAGSLVLACGKTDWPSGSVAVVFSKSSLKVYRMARGGATGKLLYSVRR